MKELIQYFEALEARITALEARVSELENRPAPEAQVIEKEVVKEVIVEKPVEKIVEKIVEIPIPSDTIGENPIQSEPVVEPEVSPDETGATLDGKGEEVASPNAVIYGKAVDDIRQAISLGDRFLYQRELFGQNAELMQRTLTELNTLKSFDEAMEYVNNHFQWDKESNTYQQFLVTLHRRFG